MSGYDGRVERSTAWLFLALVVLAVGCVETTTIHCAGGFVCPATEVCDEVHRGCVRPEQLAACALDQDDEICEIEGQPIGVCSQGVCLESRCGDSIVSGAEQCDGDNLGPREHAASCKLGFGFHDDGPVTCSPQCTYDLSACSRICGDGILDPEEVCDGEQLGVFSTCQEVGYYDGGGLTCNGACTYDTTICDRRCGDGVRDPEEVCDGAPPSDTCLDYGYDAGFLGCAALVCAPEVQSCRRFGWNRLQLPTSASIRSIASAGDTLFAGMTEGRVMTYRGGDVTVTLVDAENENYIDDIWAASPTDVWAVTDGSATLLHFDGTNWTGMPRALGFYRVLWGSGANNVYLFQTGAGSLRYNGTTWSVDPAVPVLGNARDAWGSAADDIWLLGAPATGAVYAVYHFNGTAWTTETSSVPVAQPVAVGGVGTTVFIAGSDTNGRLRVARRKNGVWDVFPLPDMTGGAVNGVARRIVARTENDVWLTTGNALWHFDGAAWTLHVQSSAWDDTAAIGYVGDEWIAGGSGSNVSTSDTLRYQGSSVVDLVEQFDPLQVDSRQIPTTNTLTAAWASAPDDIWVAARGTFSGSLDPVRMFHFDGVAWTQGFENGDLETIADLWGISSTEIYATRRNLGIVRYNGTSWSLDTQGGLAGGDPLAVWGSDSQNVWACGFGKIWRRDSTTGWAVAHNPIGRMNDVFGRGPNDVWVVGDGGAVHHWNGTQWTQQTTGTTAQLNGVWTAPGAPVFVVGADGVILEYDGTSWTTMPTPTTASLLAIYGHAPDDIFAVGDGATVLHYDGAHWSRVRVEALDPLNAVTGAGQTTLFVGGGFNPGSVVARQLNRTLPW